MKTDVSDLMIYGLIAILGRKMLSVHIYSIFLKEQSSFLYCREYCVVVMIF